MKEIKVYLQSPWKVADSPYYKYLLKDSLKNIKYLNATEKKKGVITNKRKFLFAHELKRFVRVATTNVGLSLPNAPPLRTKEEFDLIHCAHCLSRGNKPWVADFESAYQLWISSKITKTGIERAKKILSQKNCKKILPWSEDTKKNLEKFFPNIKNKIELVYPAVPEQKFKKKKRKKLTIIYASRYFWIKGGLVALEVLSKLKKRYDIEIIFISDVPEKIKKRYKNIKITSFVTQKKFFEYLNNSDIFFYPSLVDGFGFAILEAMSFGLPTIAVSTDCAKACKEIVKNNKTGFVVDFFAYKDNEIYKKCYGIKLPEKKLIDELVEQTSLLIENKKLREKMSKNCLNEIKNGKFSIKERNKKLKRIYAEALK